MKVWIVYRHTSLISGKSYIRITSQGLEKRWQSHVREANNGSDRHFHRAIRLYGKDTWNHEIIADGIYTLEDAYSLERYYINKYDTFENGYNLNEGGEGNSGIKDPKFRKEYTWEHIEYGVVIATPIELMDQYNIPLDSMRRYIKNESSNTFGWVFKGITSPPKPKLDKEALVIVYHDEYGKFEGTIQELSVITGKEVKHLSKMIKGKYKSVAGWRTTPHRELNTTCAKKVYVFEENTLIKVYNSATETSRALGLRDAQMSEWLSKIEYKEINNKVYTYNSKI